MYIFVMDVRHVRTVVLNFKFFGNAIFLLSLSVQPAIETFSFGHRII